MQLLYPCKPATETRTLPLAGGPVQMSMHVCEAGGVTFALAHANVADPRRVGPALNELRTALSGKLQGSAEAVPWKLAGAMPDGDSGRWRATGNRPDGKSLQQEFVFFAHGTRVFQGVAMGRAVSRDAADTFFDSLKLAS